VAGSDFFVGGNLRVGLVSPSMSFRRAFSLFHSGRRRSHFAIVSRSSSLSFLIPLASSPSHFVIPSLHYPGSSHFVIPAKAFSLITAKALLFGHPGEGRDPVPFSSFCFDKSSHTRHPSESWDPFASVFDRWCIAKTASRPCVIPSAILAAVSLLFAWICRVGFSPPFLFAFRLPR
jgi:hypothetical protein